MRLVKPICERARAWISTELDGELSDFEGVLLRAHLVRCAECATYAFDVRAITDVVRSTPTEVSTVSVVVPHRPSRMARPLRAGVVVAGAVAAAVTIGVSATSTGGLDRSNVVDLRKRSTQPVSASGRSFGPAVDGPLTASLAGQRPLGLRGHDDQL